MRVLTEEQIKEMKLRYYNADIHRASFVLPQFAKEVRGASQNAIYCTLKVSSSYQSRQWWVEFCCVEIGTITHVSVDGIGTKDYCL